MPKFSLLLKGAPVFLGWALVLALLPGRAQDYRPSRNFEMSKNESVTTRQDGQTYDGELTQKEYERRREKYLRKFREDHSHSEYKKEKERLEQQARESQLNKQMENAREREREWEKQEELKQQLRKNPVVVESLEDAFDQNTQDQNPPKGTNTAPQISRQKMLTELQGLQEKIKSGNVNMEDVFKALNKASGSDQVEMEVPEKYRGQMAEEVFKSLHQIRTVPPQVLTQQLKAQLNGHPLEKPLTAHEALIPKAVDVIQDPHALADASLILSNRSKLITYALINLGLFILGMLIKRRIKKSGAPWPKRFTLNLARFVGLTCVSFGVFLFFFGTHMQALWRVLTS